MNESCRRLFIASLLLAAAAAAMHADTSEATGDLQIARSGHQATLMSDGRVLVTGGSDEQGEAIGAAEIYDSATRTWSVAAANVTPRLGHAAALLRDGRVLVVGGGRSVGECEPVASAEIYDVAADSWSVVSELPVKVGRGTLAVTIEDGRVLVTGGAGCDGAYDSAALFDPSADSWARTSPMTAAAQFHVGALLDDGRVLVSGASTMMYDPRTAQWLPLGDSRPLTEAPCEGDVDRYAPVLRRQSHLARAAADDCPSVTVMPGGTLLVAGGLSTAGVALDSVRLSDLTTGETRRTWPMHGARAGHTATRLRNGALLIAGGRNGGARLATSEIYIPRRMYETSIRATPRGAHDRVVGYSADYGEWLATATTPRNHLLISYRGGTGDGTNLLEWDLSRWRGHPSTWPKPRYPPYVRALAPDVPPLDSIRIDREGNIWGVSADSNEVFKLDPAGKMLMRLANPASPEAGESTAPSPRRYRLDRPSDLAVDRRGNIFVVNAGERPGIVKFDARGRFLAAAGRRGSGPGQLDGARSIAADAGGNIYVADSGNARIQVFDGSLKPLGIIDHIGTPWAICIGGESPQFLYSASNPDRVRRARRIGEIYQVELDGTILGKAVGTDGNSLMHSLDHIHCLDATAFVGLGVHNLHEFRFEQR